MDNFEIVIFLLTILIALSAAADNIKVPYPILLVIVGLIIGFVPFLPNLELNPDIIFVVFLPPLLYDAAFKTSWHEFRKEIRTISTLAISLVFFTTIIVAIATHYLIPGFTWPLSFLLGAIISPPDAVAAGSITRGLGLNKKVLTIIEGESLVNDAAAIIAYRYAVAAVGSGIFILWEAGLGFIVVSAGGILVGLVVAYILVFAHEKIKDNAIVETSISLLTPFIAYLLAERFHTSGVLAVVTAGLFISWQSRKVFSSETRLQTRAVWETLEFLLNGIVFILIGLQLPKAVKDLKTTTVFELIGYGLIISVVTMVIRIVWVVAGAYHQTLLSRKRIQNQQADKVDTVSWKNVLIVAWTGTRGVVSLATALAVPLTLPDASPFPKRHSIILLSFIVILVTLIVQGLTLPLLIRLLNLKPQEGKKRKEEKDLQISLSESILEYLHKDFPIKLDEKVLIQIKKQYELTLSLLSPDQWHKKGNKQEGLPQLAHVNQMLAAQLEIVNFERELLIEYHRQGTFSDEIIRKAEEELDLEELRLKAMVVKRN